MYEDDPFDPDAIRAAAQRKLDEERAKNAENEQGRTPGGVLQNAMQGAQHGSIGGPWGMLGGALAEGAWGAVDQKGLNKFRKNVGSVAGPASSLAASYFKK